LLRTGIILLLRSCGCLV